MYIKILWSELLVILQVRDWIQTVCVFFPSGGKLRVPLVSQTCLCGIWLVRILVMNCAPQDQSKPFCYLTGLHLPDPSPKEVAHPPLHIARVTGSALWELAFPGTHLCVVDIQNRVGPRWTESRVRNTLSRTLFQGFYEAEGERCKWLDQCPEMRMNGLFCEFLPSLCPFLLECGQRSALK